jgi:hypothetical protein
VQGRTPGRLLRPELAAMRAEARATQAHCHGHAAALAPATADELRAAAQRTRSRAAETALVWLKAGTDPVAAWAVLAMAEAGEVAAWTAVERLARAAVDEALVELSEWALPVQERHLRSALDGVGRLAAADAALELALP